jgi:hypothetical protein
MAEYDIGTAVTLTATFRNDDGALADPTAVTITVKKPSGTTDVYTGGALTHPSTGVYEVVVTPTESGNWRWKAVGTGAVTVAEQDVFQVARDRVLA